MGITGQLDNVSKTLVFRSVRIELRKQLVSALLTLYLPVAFDERENGKPGFLCTSIFSDPSPRARLVALQWRDKH